MIMSWSDGIGREVTATFGGKSINITKSVEYNPEPIKAETSKMFSFDTDADLTFPSSVEFNGSIQYIDGRKLKLKAMKLSGCETPFKYSFDCGSVLISSIMKTKGKQPRKVAVWREL
jgi:hypothetical protein